MIASELLFDVRQVTPKDADLSDIRGKFVDLYRAIFAEPPYREEYDAGTVQKRFDKLIKGLFFVAAQESELIGFACALPLDLNSDDLNDKIFINYAKATYLHPEQFWYIRELAVAKKFRGRELGDMRPSHLLLDHLLGAIGDRPVALDTAAEGNDRVIELYKGRRFIEITQLHKRIVEKHRDDGSLAGRPIPAVFMAKNLGKAEM